MADVTPKIKLYVFISCIGILLSVISVIGNIWHESTAYNISNTNPDINNGKVSGNNTNYIAEFGGQSLTSFLPFVSIVYTYTLPEPLNVIMNFIILVIGAIQVFLLIVIVANLIPFENV